MTHEPTHIDLFAGIGGFSLAFEAEGFRTIAYSEINPDKCLVYDEWFPGCRNIGDVKGLIRCRPGRSPRPTLAGLELADEIGPVDVVTGGVPCQPASALGQMRGTADERWLWPETIGLVRLFRPRFGVFENPPSLLILEDGRAWNGIVSELATLGYDCWWDVFPAAAFGAGHLRERVLLVIADADRKRRKGQGDNSRSGSAAADRTQQNDSSIANRKGCVNAHSDHARLQGHSGNGANGHGRTPARRPTAPPDLRGRADRHDWWHETHTGIPVLADGLPARLVEAAARCAGDAVVPQVIQPIARAIYQQLHSA